LHKTAHDLLDEFEQWTMTHVRREKNTRADALSKEGIQIGS